MDIRAKWQKAKPYIISSAISLGVGVLSALLTRGNMDIYSEIKTPPLSPPSWLFPIVWTILFILMGISAAIIWQKNGTKLDRALKTYALSLAVNFSWSLVFFNWRAFLLAVIVVLILWVLILLTILSYRPIDAFAAYLQIPYLLWVSFASYLTIAIYLLNRR